MTNSANTPNNKLPDANDPKALRQAVLDHMHAQRIALPKSKMGPKSASDARPRSGVPRAAA